MPTPNPTDLQEVAVPNLEECKDRVYNPLRPALYAPSELAYLRKHGMTGVADVGEK